MTTYAALVDANHLVKQRIVLADVGSYTPSPGLTLVIETAQTGASSVGYTWNGTTFTTPLSNPDPTPTPDQLRQQSFVAQSDRADLVTRLQSATPAQIDNWLTNNVTNLTQARAVLGAIIKVFCANPPPQ